MNKSFFEPIECGETLPVKNIHAVSVCMPTIQDVIDYEEQTPEILEKITSGYPRFVLHPYLKKLGSFIKKKYQICDGYEVVLLSSKQAVELVSNKYWINNPITIDEPFSSANLIPNLNTAGSSGFAYPTVGNVPSGIS